MDESWNDGIVL